MHRNAGRRQRLQNCESPRRSTSAHSLSILIGESAIIGSEKSQIACWCASPHVGLVFLYFWVVSLLGWFQFKSTQESKTMCALAYGTSFRERRIYYLFFCLNKQFEKYYILLKTPQNDRAVKER